MSKTMDFYDKYLIQDGLHEVEKEAKLYEKEYGNRPRFMGDDKPTTHKVYKFPNGYGASVVHGWISMGKYEIMLAEFDEDGAWSVIGDYIRCENYEDLAEYLKSIYDLGRLFLIEDNK